MVLGKWEKSGLACAALLQVVDLKEKSVLSQTCRVGGRDVRGNTFARAVAGAGPVGSGYQAPVRRELRCRG